MKYILTLFVLIVVMSAHAQRLYLHEVESGNYRSFDLGDPIEVLVKNHDGSVKGVITALQRDGFTLNDTFQVKIADATGLVTKAGGTYTVGRIALIVLGSYVVITGVEGLIIGLAITTFFPPLGIVVAALGAGITYGGYAIIKRQVQKARARKSNIAALDQQHYRLFIE